MTTEKNKMIAKFMYPNWVDFKNNYDNISNNLNAVKGSYSTLCHIHKKEWSMLNFHSSWDKIMPVVEKIIEHKFDNGENHYLRTFGMKDEEGNFMVRFNRGFLHSDPNLLIATYNAVCEFIKWYNENKKP